VDPLPMSILPPCLTQVTHAGFKPGRLLPPTWTCAPLPAALGAVLEAGPAVWLPLEQATSADAQPRVQIAAARRRFTGFPSFARRPVGVVMGEYRTPELLLISIFVASTR
jgi:hypothetical protein